MENREGQKIWQMGMKKELCMQTHLSQNLVCHIFHTDKRREKTNDDAQSLLQISCKNSIKGGGFLAKKKLP